MFVFVPYYSYAQLCITVIPLNCFKQSVTLKGHTVDRGMNTFTKEYIVELCLHSFQKRQLQKDSQGCACLLLQRRERKLIA